MPTLADRAPMKDDDDCAEKEKPLPGGPTLPPAEVEKSEVGCLASGVGVAASGCCVPDAEGGGSSGMPTRQG